MKIFSVNKTVSEELGDHYPEERSYQTNYKNHYIHQRIIDNNYQDFYNFQLNQEKNLITPRFQNSLRFQ